MSLQLLRKSASDFTPDSGSKISFDTNHLKCDDFLVSGGTLPRQVFTADMLSDGRYICVTKYYAYLYLFTADLSSVAQHALSDSDAVQKASMCRDSSDNVYLARWVNPGSIKKYSNTGTFIWEFTGVGSTPGAYNWTGGLFYHNSLIYSTSRYNHYLFIINEAGNFVNEIDLTAGASGIQRPRDVWVTDDYIYVRCNYGHMGRWDTTTLAFVDNISASPYGYQNSAEFSIHRLSSGNFIMADGFNAAIDHGVCYVLIDGTDYNEIRRLTFNTNVSNAITDAVKGGVFRSEYGLSNIVIDETNKFMYVGAYKSAGSAENTKIIKINMKDCTERYATVTHNFGATVNMKNISIKAKHSRNSGLNLLRAWYNIGVGDVEIDLTDGSMNVPCSSVTSKIGMQSYGALRDWPEFYYMDIEYEDNIPATGQKINVDQEVL